MTRRVLIVSPHFPPVNTADMHRVRMLLPFFRENGWIAEVLAVSPDHVEAPRDPWLLRGLPRELVVHRVQTLGLRWTRIPGLGTLGLRALRPLARAGDLILANGGFDLVYFSTTVFEVHLLGARWRRRLGVPFVMDYQDPWVNDYYREHPDIVPPGGRLKYLLAGSLHRWMEPRVLRACAGLTCVSPDYPQRLVERYPWTDALPCLVEAFPVRGGTSSSSGVLARLSNASILETATFIGSTSVEVAVTWQRHFGASLRPSGKTPRSP
jgi:hypothetical protein